MEDTERLMAFFRRSETQTLLVLANYRQEDRTLTLPAPCKKILLNNYRMLYTENETEITLQAYQAVILELERQTETV